LTAPRDLIELEPDEELLAVAYASFRGAAATSVRSTFALGSARMRMRAFDTWHAAATASGFPTVPPDMVVAVSDTRVLFGKPTFWGGRPSRFWSAFDLDQVSQVVVLRHGLVTGTAFAFTHGAIVEIEAMRSRKLRRVVHIIEEHLTGRIA
jgi:hypothetical protein